MAVQGRLVVGQLHRRQRDARAPHLGGEVMRQGQSHLEFFAEFHVLSPKRPPRGVPDAIATAPRSPFEEAIVEAGVGAPVR